MKRGTTPTHTFTVPFDTAGISEARVIYSQQGRTVLVKTDLTMEKNVITVRLTQEDTFRFSPDRVDIQLRVKFPDGTVLASDIRTVPVERCLEEVVM